MGQKRFKEVDNVKWILTLLIVLYHIPPPDFTGEKQYFVFMAIKNLGDSVVPAFAILSGFLFWKNVDSMQIIKEKCIRRISLLLVPYLLWNTIHAFLLNILEFDWSQGNYLALFEINLWTDVIEWTSSPHFWYIFMLMFWTILSPVLFFVYTKRFGIVVLFAVSSTYIIYMGDGILNSRFIYIIYLWSGFLGVCKPRLLECIIQWPKKRKICLSVFSIVVYGVVYLFYFQVKPSMGLQVWLCGIRAVALLLVCLNLPLMKIGNITGYKYSFWLFAVHYHMDGYVSRIVFGRGFSPLIGQLIVWIFVVCLGVLTGMIVFKFLPKAFSVLVGSRSINKVKYE